MAFDWGRRRGELRCLKAHIEETARMLRESRGHVNRWDEALEKTRRTAAAIHDKKRAATGMPVGLFYDIMAALYLDPADRFSSELRDAEELNKAAERDAVEGRAEATRIVSQLDMRLHHLEQMLRCAGSRPGTIDYEVYRVLERYLDAGTDVTIDEAVGVALANVYTGDASELRRVATCGRLALREVGNCAADVVFDPKIRQRMAKRHRQLGEWSRHEVMKEYLAIAEESADHSTVKAYMIDSGQLRALPEHILYGLVVCGHGHAMRILAVEDHGLRVVEGNWNGGLSFGRFVPFGEITWGSAGLIVYSRQLCGRQGLEREFTPYEYANPDAVGYKSLREYRDDMYRFGYFKVRDDRLLTLLPPQIRDSLSVLRFTPGKSYDITWYAHLVDAAPLLFPGCAHQDVVSALVRTACRNPTASVVISTIASDESRCRLLSHVGREVPPDAAKQMYVFFDEEGGDEVSLHQLKRITDGARQQHGDTVPRIILLGVEEFMGLDEDQRRGTALLTPRLDDKGNHVDAESYFEEHLMRVLQDEPHVLMETDGECGRAVSFEELARNPLHALILIEKPYDMLGIGTRLTPDERSVLDKHVFRGTEDATRKLIDRKFEIRGTVVGGFG